MTFDHLKLVRIRVTNWFFCKNFSYKFRIILGVSNRFKVVADKNMRKMLNIVEDLIKQYVGSRF